MPDFDVESFLRRYSSISQLQNDLELNPTSISCPRALLWEIALVFKSLDDATWIELCRSNRSKYSGYTERFHVSIDVDNYLLTGTSYDASEDHEIQLLILQDLNRTSANVPLFRQPDTIKTLLRVMYIYAKQYPDVGYRQGMHEILANTYYVLHQNLRTDSDHSSTLLNTLFAPLYIEHDTYSLFSAIMKHAYRWYLPPSSLSDVPPIVSISQKIQHQYIHAIDPELDKHLNDLSIEPQIWAIKFIRLMFSREFSLDFTLNLWDYIFLLGRDSEQFDLVYFIIVAMLYRIRDSLLHASHTEAVNILLHYPTDPDMSCHTLTSEAIGIRSTIIHTYSPSPILLNDKPYRDVAKSFTKNVHDTSERLGVNKLVKRGIKNAKEIAREISNPSSRLSPALNEKRPKRNSEMAAALAASVKVLQEPNVSQLDKDDAISTINHVISCLNNDSIVVMDSTTKAFINAPRSTSTSLSTTPLPSMSLSATSSAEFEGIAWDLERATLGSEYVEPSQKPTVTYGKASPKKSEEQSRLLASLLS
ncbi:hypothetical protein CANCADRAFT_3675 [Tortispora caseinolytica NRRL Y-17796]|uniref:Rab-GAP TBC domain-containing protein n=1 Tax=Tortispora caseinolytica NRRL Y-17796 TaxID=767744 RepID=A0A1E4TBE9_9ASCO|nr:hypothetical protein CANCADRAFT_3675 [Tortispora caseinolytica NRRL Y-17796]